MIRLALVGLGKMGMSHYSMINVHPSVTLVAVCDSAKYMLDVLSKYTGVKTYTSYEQLLANEHLDGIIIATPSRTHGSMVSAALERGLHVFCEKPFCLDVQEGEALTRLAAEKGVVTQVGYHYRFVAAFEELRRLLDVGAIGNVTHILAEAYGPVVLKTRGSTWRTQRGEGGGCLYDYAAHPINLVNWYFGSPRAVGGTVLNKIFSLDTDDEVYSTLFFGDGKSAQISVNWSDESYRKMSTKITVWGSHGRLYADRQECHAYLSAPSFVPDGYGLGWNVRYTTDMTPEVWFYLRGEEYSAQLDYFVKCILEGRKANVNAFASALETDRVMSWMIADAERGLRTREISAGRVKRSGWFRRWYSRTS